MSRMRGRMDYREVVTTALDVLAVLLLAFGLAACAYPFVGWACTAVAAVVVLGAVRVDEWNQRRGGAS